MSRQGHEIIVLGKTKDHLTRIKEIKEDKITFILLPHKLKIPQSSFSDTLPKRSWLLIKRIFDSLTMLPGIMLTINKYKKIDAIVFYGFFFAPVAFMTRLLGYPSFLNLFAFLEEWALLPDAKRCSLRNSIWKIFLQPFNAVITNNTTYWRLSGEAISNLDLLRGLLGHDRVYYLPLGVDVGAFEKIRPDHRLLEAKKDGSVIIICPRRLSPEKGVQYLVDAIPYVARECKNVLFVLTGEGPLKDTLVKKISALNVERFVFFTGNTPYNLHLSYIKASDIVVLPSLGGEIFGIAILEAFALRKPVIGTRIGGIPNIVEEGKSGILVEPANSKQLAKAIVTSIRFPELRTETAEYGHKLLQKQFDLENITKRLLIILARHCRKRCLPSD